MKDARLATFVKNAANVAYMLPVIQEYFTTNEIQGKKNKINIFNNLNRIKLFFIQQ